MVRYSQVTRSYSIDMIEERREERGERRDMRDERGRR